MGLVAGRPQGDLGSKRFRIPARSANGWHSGVLGHGCFRSPDGTDGAYSGFGKADFCSKPRANSRHRA